MNYVAIFRKQYAVGVWHDRALDIRAADDSADAKHRATKLAARRGWNDEGYTFHHMRYGTDDGELGPVVDPVVGSTVFAGSPMTTTGMRFDEFRAMGETLYGANWMTAVARDLKVADRTVQRWATGYASIPASILPKFATLCRDRAAAIAKLADDLDKQSQADRILAVLKPEGTTP